ncbi:WAT1-related protein At5g64700-like [Abrus precatorius]|uniref:WAT1-related protein n=1 Tax=Abrus precatorius TaxID=3816 RepID=A0A8B8MLE4_ABRPR|nr:WAT1-related protein At5g64700-like [Abrus precatorius]
METKKRKGTLKEWFASSQALLSMLLVQIFMTGLQLLARAALVQGSFILALVSYRHIVAAICVAPFAFYFERGRTKKFTFEVWFLLFINAMLGMTMAQGFFYYGLRDTSATYSVNFLNLIPICTFFVSVICRMEKLRLQTWAGKAKSIGAIMCVGGALTSSLYRGKEFYLGHRNHHTSTAAVHKTNMLCGTFFLIGSSFSYSLWFIAQVKLLKVFPLRCWGIMMTCIFAAIQGAIIGVCIDTSKAAWRIEWNLQLATIVYSGALATAAAFCLVSWAIALKGPTYPPMFNPLTLVFVAFAEAIFLGEPLSVGTLLGVVLIMLGLYSFLWGKSNETVLMAQPTPNIAASEVASMTNLPAGVQSTATVAPSSSPVSSVVLEIERTNPN